MKELGDLVYVENHISEVPIGWYVISDRTTEKRIYIKSANEQTGDFDIMFHYGRWVKSDDVLSCEEYRDLLIKQIEEV